MRQRALIQVAGPSGSGKTTFIERLLAAQVAFGTFIRATRDPTRGEARESAPKGHPELRRFRDAGASAAACYTFSTPNADDFFCSEVIETYSEAVFIEGDRPTEFADLEVFVAPPPRPGRSLLRRVLRDRTAAHAASVRQLEEALESPEALVKLLGAGLGDPLLGFALRSPKAFDELRKSMGAGLRELRHQPAPEPTEHWELGPEYQGLERAQLVVVNVRTETERAEGTTLLKEVSRLRTDATVSKDVLGIRGSKLPITAVVADLSNPKDPGVKKAVARVRRATKAARR